MSLTTEQGRKKAIEAIEQSFIQSLRDIGVELSDTAYCNLNDFITYVYCSKESNFGVNIMVRPSGNTISYSASFGFTPNDKEQYWITIHAASILKNWDKVCETVNEHCKRYSELVNEIQKQNP